MEKPMNEAAARITINKQENPAGTLARMVGIMLQGATCLQGKSLRN